MTSVVEAPPPPALPAAREPAGAVLAAWALLGLVAVVVAVALGGAAPQPAPPGLPDAGPLPGWSLPLVRLAGHAAVLLVAGVLLAGLLGAARPRRALVAAAAFVSAGTGVATWLLVTAEVVGRPVQQVLQADLLRYAALELPQGRAALQGAALALGVVALAPWVHRRPAAAVALVGTLGGCVPALLVGHAASEGDHRTAQALLVLHVVAAVLWVGGLTALALVPAGAALAAAVLRFSPLALVCALAVGLTGTASVLLRIDGLSPLLGSGYGALVLLKTALLAGLVLAGARHRRETLPALRADVPGAFRRLAVVEVAGMAVAFGLAAALARTPL